MFRIKHETSQVTGPQWSNANLMLIMLLQEARMLTYENKMYQSATPSATAF
jgi:hypothetical protein